MYQLEVCCRDCCQQRAQAQLLRHWETVLLSCSGMAALRQKLPRLALYRVRPLQALYLHLDPCSLGKHGKAFTSIAEEAGAPLSASQDRTPVPEMKGGDDNVKAIEVTADVPGELLIGGEPAEVR